MVDRRLHPLYLSLLLAGANAQQHNARHRPPLSEDEFTEILVFRQQRTALTRRVAHHLGITRPRHKVGQVDDIVAGLAQESDES
jgi:hypothetical protein